MKNAFDVSPSLSSEAITTAILQQSILDEQSLLQNWSQPSSPTKHIFRREIQQPDVLKIQSTEQFREYINSKVYANSSKAHNIWKLINWIKHISKTMDLTFVQRLETTSTTKNKIACVRRNVFYLNPIIVSIMWLLKLPYSVYLL